jgi:hypothetical protein
VGLPWKRQRHERANLAQKFQRRIVRNRNFGLKNISLHLNTEGWSMLLAKKLFGL